MDPSLPVSGACQALVLPRATTFYRHQKRVSARSQPKERSAPPRSLDSEERKRVLDVLHEERFVDKAPAEVYATLLDEGLYLCSIRTMCRIEHR